jgi:hypothetical protein
MRKSRHDEFRNCAAGSDALYGGRGESKDIVSVAVYCVEEKRSAVVVVNLFVRTWVGVLCGGCELGLSGELWCSGMTRRAAGGRISVDSATSSSR